MAGPALACFSFKEARGGAFRPAQWSRAEPRSTPSTIASREARERASKRARRLPTGQGLTHSELRGALRTDGFFEGAQPQSEPVLLSRFIERLESVGRARKGTKGTVTLIARSELA